MKTEKKTAALVNELERRTTLLVKAARRYLDVDGPDRTWTERKNSNYELSAAVLVMEGKEIPSILRPALERLEEAR